MPGTSTNTNRNSSSRRESGSSSRTAGRSRRSSSSAKSKAKDSVPSSSRRLHEKKGGGRCHPSASRNRRRLSRTVRNSLSAWFPRSAHTYMVHGRWQMHAEKVSLFLEQVSGYVDPRIHREVCRWLCIYRLSDSPRVVWCYGACLSEVFWSLHMKY